MEAAKQEARTRLHGLLEDFAGLAGEQDLSKIPEATARSWIERFLSVFGWDPLDPRQVVQEYRITGREARRLRREGMTHNRPDYALMVNERRILYIDAKRFSVDVEND
ncbi:MAG: hypothetical protein QME96_03000, partial [Myxococcota bacterium]|nr:hypothetical protein [Myxococcota bacterium]